MRTILLICALLTSSCVTYQSRYMGRNWRKYITYEGTVIERYVIIKGSAVINRYNLFRFAKRKMRLMECDAVEWVSIKAREVHAICVDIPR